MLPFDFKNRTEICKLEMPWTGGSICEYNKTSRLNRLDKYQDNLERGDVYLSNIPAGCGYKGPIHYL